MFSNSIIVDLLIILGVLTIVFSYILVILYYWKVINEKLDEKVSDSDKEILNKLEERLNGKN